MTNAIRVIPVLLALASATVAVAQHDIDDPYYAAEGTATIDGDLSDWAGATWIPLDYTFTGTPTDISDAKYALRWSSTTNLLYVAASAVDTNLMLSDWYIDWRAHDHLEVFVDAGQNDIDFTLRSDYGQWLTLGAAPDPDPAWLCWSSAAMVGADMCPEFAAEVDGDTISYELSIVPHSYYTSLGGSDLPAAVVTLAEGVDIGLDVMALSRDGSTIGQLANNSVGIKPRQGQAFQTWILGEEPSSCSPGDADGDGDVDLDDFVILKKNFATATGADCSMGDFDDDGDVDLDDFVLLKQNFATAAVPEPTSMSLMVLGGLALIRRRRS